MSNSSTAALLGCIADDVTGATDLASNLVAGGLRVVQILGLPEPPLLSSLPESDAIVVALKIRATPPAEAADAATQALAALRRLGVERFYYKYCSTFDSTDRGNIGPVSEALMGALGLEQTLFCPAFPRAGRTVFQGHLFVGEVLLSESGMQHHPINPMRDPDLKRCLARQAGRPVGLLPHRVIRQGAAAVDGHLKRLGEEGIALVIADTCGDEDLAVIAQAVALMPLVTGGSGLARYLPAVYRSQGLALDAEASSWRPRRLGRSAVVAGSCSEATQAQVRRMSESGPAWRIDVASLLADAERELERLRGWVTEQPRDRPLLVASTAAPDQVRQVQDRFGAERVAGAVECFLAHVTEILVRDLQVRQLVIAGGETAGAVVNRLGLRALRIGPEICAGVPWTETIGFQPPLALALKSGNFGDVDFFEQALEMLS